VETKSGREHCFNTTTFIGQPRDWGIWRIGHTERSKSYTGGNPCRGASISQKPLALLVRLVADCCKE